MKKFWDNLGAREKLLRPGRSGDRGSDSPVPVHNPAFWEDRARVAKALDAQEKVLEEMNAQLSEYLVIKRDTEIIQRAMASRPPDFTLYGFVERKAREAGVRPTSRPSIPPGV